MSTITPLPRPTDISAVVASELRVLMARYGKTQRDLAALLEISQGQMSKRMRGTIPLDIAELQRLAVYFNTSVAALVGGTPGGGNTPDPKWAPWGSNPQPTDYRSAQVIPFPSAA